MPPTRLGYVVAAASAGVLFATILATRAASAGTNAATPTPHPPPAFHLMRLADGDYTIPLSELKASGTRGTVLLHPVGPKTIVSVVVLGGAGRHTLSLVPGSACVANGAGNTVALAPSFNGQHSQTLVSLPISNLTSQPYFVQVRSATAQRQKAEACANLR